MVDLKSEMAQYPPQGEPSVQVCEQTSESRRLPTEMPPRVLRELPHYKEKIRGSVQADPQS